jgi:hypothetical protein
MYIIRLILALGESETAAIGDLKGLSSNAQVMVKMAVFSAWAELQIASSEQAYLIDVLKPHIAKLTPLWLSSLREYARLRFEPDISSMGSASLSGSLDTIYAALNRETLLKVGTIMSALRTRLMSCSFIKSPGSILLTRLQALSTKTANSFLMH